MAIRDQLQTLLCNGVNPAAAAAAVGCEPSYVSELMLDPAFAAAVTNARVNVLQAATKRDGKWDELEDLLLVKMKTLVPFIVQPNEVMSALAKVNAAKRRGVPAEAAASITVNNVVVLQLPQAIKHKYATNNNNEVVEVDGRTLLTIDRSALAAQLHGAQNANSNTNSQLAVTAR